MAVRLCTDAEVNLATFRCAVLRAAPVRSLLELQAHHQAAPRQGLRYHLCGTPRSQETGIVARRRSAAQSAATHPLCAAPIEMETARRQCAVVHAIAMARQPLSARMGLALLHCVEQAVTACRSLA